MPSVSPRSESLKIRLSSAGQSSQAADPQAVAADFPLGFEADHDLRSAFIRRLTLLQLHGPAISANTTSAIPKTLIRYWHDPDDLPSDVRECLESWEKLQDQGFELQLFNDLTAAAYVGQHYGEREKVAFSRCRHPAMRCDYLRMCVLLKEGGFYVDADDVLLNDGWRAIFLDSKLKVQPLCYDLNLPGMLPATEIWRADLPTAGRIFYVNNDPLAGPPGHPVLARALARATEQLLGNSSPEIQSTTGPGNLTAVLAAHARETMTAGRSLDVAFIREWDSAVETRWNLSYKKDARNWRNMNDNQPSAREGTPL